MALVAISCMAIFPPWELVGAWIRPLPVSVQEQIDEAINHGFDGVIVYIDKAEQDPALYAAGWHNREIQIPADPQALFKIASINKLYVAVAAVKLVGEGVLSLDDTLANHFPELIGKMKYAEQITLRQLLQHRSGIPNYMDHPDYPWDDPPVGSRENLKLALAMSADFKPDRKYSYSNTNYLLIAEMIEKVTGESLFHLVTEDILIPLKLSNTFRSLRDVDIDDVMSGYHFGWEPDVKTNYFGGMVATAEDVGIFLRALNDGTLLDDQEQAIYSSVYEYEHTGLLPGYQSIARYHEDIDTVVIQFTNTGGGTMWEMSAIIYNRVIRILRRQAGTVM